MDRKEKLKTPGKIRIQMQLKLGHTYFLTKNQLLQKKKQQDNNNQ